ncbi:MAG: Uma2 family endonuclease [Pseudomonadota bacterium]
MNKYAPADAKWKPLTFDDVLALIKAGHLEEGGPTELIDGALYEMPSEGIQHVKHKAQVVAYLNRSLDPDAWVVIPDATLVLSPVNAPSPDIYVFPASIREEDLTGDGVALLIEISDTTSSDDLRTKKALYADHDIREYWVVNLEQSITHVFRSPIEGDWAETEEIPFDAPLTPAAIPDVSLIIAELPRLRR